MIVLYVPEKRFEIKALFKFIFTFATFGRLYMGFIPHDQEEFFKAMRQMIENHKKEQAAKQQKMVGTSKMFQECMYYALGIMLYMYYALGITLQLTYCN